METINNELCLLRQSRLVSVSDAASCIVAGTLGGYAYLFSSYRESLHSNGTIGMWLNLFGFGYIICTLLSAIISIVLIFRVTISLGKVKGYWGGIRGLFVVLVTLGIFMPTLGKSNSSMYRAKAYSVVYPALWQFNDTPQAKELGGPFQIDDYKIEIREAFEQKPNLVEVRYELNRKIELDSFPQRFSVILNREDGSAELWKEGIPKEIP